MNTDPEVLSPDAETPDLSLMPRADGLAALTELQAKAEQLKTTAETLQVASIDDTNSMKLARVTRLSLREIRIAVDKKRIELVEDKTREVKRINSAAKAVRDFIEPLEERLLKLELFAEQERDRLRDERRKERLALVAPFLTSPPAVDLGLMEPEAWDVWFADQKDLHELKIQREQKAEADRLAKEKAEAEERERMRLENERLKAEAEAREAEAAKERAAAAAKQREIEEAAARDREAAAAKQRELEKQAAADRKKAQDALLKSQEAARRDREAADAALRKEREAVAAEKRQAEEKAAAEAAAAKRAAAKAAAAPDKEKLLAFAESVKHLQMPPLSSPAGQAVGDEVAAKIMSFARWIITQADTL